MNICFLITTYNRQQSCQRLVDSLQGLGDIIVANDGSDYTIEGATNLNPHIHLGKKGYWKLVNMLWRNRTQAKYYIMLPDDFLICDSQIANAIEIWESITDTKRICLSIAEGRPNHTCWTGFKAREVGNVWLTQWVDMCFICENTFFNVLGAIPHLHKHKQGVIRGSSGVGAHISRYLHRRKLNMYQVKESLVTVQEEHCFSQMHKIK